MDIAVDPLEGTTHHRQGRRRTRSPWWRWRSSGNFLHAPDIYMDKIAVGGGLPEGVVDLDAPIGENLRNLARAKKRDISDLVVCMLERERHAEHLAKCREAGARTMLMPDGDVAGVIATAQPESGMDIFVGSGGAPEGVLAAAALRCIGGQMQGRLLFENDEQVRARARNGRRRSAAQIQRRRDGAGRRDVRRHRRHLGRDAARRAALRHRRDHAFDGDAQQVRHGALHRGAPQFRDQDLEPGLRDGARAGSTSRPKPALGVGAQPERAALGLAQRRGPHRLRHRAAPRRAGDRRPPARCARHRSRHRRRFPGARPCVRCCPIPRCSPTWMRRPSASRAPSAAARRSRCSAITTWTAPAAPR